MRQARDAGFREEATSFEAATRAGDRPVREVQASEAKTHLLQLLDDVERGETIVITRRGRAIARLVPEAQQRRRDIEEAFAEIDKIARERREEFGPVTLEEMLAWRHEGHKY
ncbi:MAG TPA: type II toxin-antitoxin system prevent-host-death family antitoxin [Stellaceae bacterium]|nr:type II toxin-antitoxin system prevent-host-death family antitoxin [Stellaceae bacterium]